MSASPSPSRDGAPATHDRGTTVEEVESVATERDTYRRQLETVAENATLALFIMDERQRCTYMNAAAERLTGFRLDELQGKPLHYYLHHTRPDGTPYPLEECPIDQAFPGNMREQGEEVFVHKDGSFYDVAFTASPIRDGARTVGTIIEVRDIREEKARERERERLVATLRGERARLADVFRLAPVFFSVVRGVDYVFELANEAYYQLVGHRELLGRPVFEALPEARGQGFEALLDQVMATGEPFVGRALPVRLARTPGQPSEERFVDFVYQVLREPDGTWERIVATGTDVTDHVLARREVERLLAESEDARRMLADANAQLEEQRVELEFMNQQLQESAVELEAQAAELEMQAEELHATAAQLEERTEEAETARHAAEREREQLHRILAQTPVALAVYEGSDLRVRAMSAAYERVIGHRAALGRQIRAALPELEGQGFFELMEQVYATGEPVAASNAPARWDADGDGVPEDHTIDFTYAPLLGADGRPEGIVAVVLDVSERARLERAERDARSAAEESAVRLAAVLDALPDAAAVYDVDWRYTYLNPGARALHVEILGLAGVPPEAAAGAALGRVAWEVFPWLVGTKLERESRRAVAERQTVEYLEYVAPLERWYETRIVPTAAGAVSLNRDVTTQYAAQAERERLLAAERVARADAEAANKAKSEFLATMSHELRTPLNAIQGHVQLLEMGIHGPATEPQRQAFARIDRAQRHLLGLIDDILSYARLEGGRVEYDLQPVLVSDVVHEIMPMVEPQLAAKRLTLDVRLPEGTDEPPTPVSADREKLAQVLLNLLSNAVKFTPAGGWVTVEVSDRDDGSSSPEVVFLRVHDTGVGIPRDKLEAIFEPFVQVRGAYAPGQGGTGLGLAISRDLARGMGGDLRARSVEGEGSTFTLTLRRAAAPAPGPIDHAGPEERRASVKKRGGGEDDGGATERL